MPQKTALIAGALGVTGRALVQHLSTDPDWSVIALSRRAPDFPTGARFLSVNLLDREDTARMLGGLSEVTHVFFTAYAPHPDVAAEIPLNVGMLANLMDALEPVADLQHVQLMHGAKWYGTFLGKYRTRRARTTRARPSNTSITPSRTGWKHARAARAGAGRRSAPTGSGASRWAAP